MRICHRRPADKRLITCRGDRNTFLSPRATMLDSLQLVRGTARLSLQANIITWRRSAQIRRVDTRRVCRSRTPRRGKGNKLFVRSIKPSRIMKINETIFGLK